MYRPKRLAGAPAPKPPSRFRKRAEEPIEEHLEELPDDTHTLPQPSQEEVKETISSQEAPDVAPSWDETPAEEAPVQTSVAVRVRRPRTNHATRFALPQVEAHYQRAQEGQSRPRRSRPKGSPLLSLLFFPCVILYHELLLRLFEGEGSFFSLALVRLVLFSLAAGLLIFLVVDLLPWRRAARIVGGVLVGLGTVILCTEYCCKSFFQTYFGFGYMQGMAGQVVGDFGGTMVTVILGRIPFILLSLIPLILYIFLAKTLIHQRTQTAQARILIALILVVLQMVGVLLCRVGEDKRYYTYDYSTNAAIPRFGVVNTLRLELQYALFGVPEAPLEQLAPDDTADVTPSPSQSPGTEDPAPSQPIEYGYNQLDIDFEGLAAGASSDTLAALHQFMGSLTPSQQNEYTGYFKGKNLILITAEAFSPYVIDPELTPTLYRLTHEGFVFENFYQPDWTQSTTGGEFAVMTGLIPTWINGSQLSFRVSATKSMPYALGWQFAKLGYATPAYHNNTYTYYGRSETHPNLGYDYQGIGNGLELKNPTVWPASDLDMMESTVSSYIDNYVNNGTPFHAYYMTVSGHCNYTWSDNAMSAKNREIIQARYPNASEQVQAYLACNLELEYAMEYLVEQLEAAGIADDTVIALSPDHYPYAMDEGSVSYYDELAGTQLGDLDRYRNTFILWCGGMEEPVVVDTPCSAIDIVPTLSNLFGLEYDSRLYSGRDVFATNYDPALYSTCMPLVIFANKGSGNSWITDAGSYNCNTGTFTPNEGITVAEDYVGKVTRLVQAKYNYAKLMIQEDYYAQVLG